MAQDGFIFSWCAANSLNERTAAALASCRVNTQESLNLLTDADVNGLKGVTLGQKAIIRKILHLTPRLDMPRVPPIGTNESKRRRPRDGRDPYAHLSTYEKIQLQRKLRTSEPSMNASESGRSTVSRPPENIRQPVTNATKPAERPEEDEPEPVRQADNVQQYHVESAPKGQRSATSSRHSLNHFEEGPNDLFWEDLKEDTKNETKDETAVWETFNYPVEDNEDEGIEDEKQHEQDSATFHDEEENRVVPLSPRRPSPRREVEKQENANALDSVASTQYQVSAKQPEAKENPPATAQSPRASSAKPVNHPPPIDSPAPEESPPPEKSTSPAPRQLNHNDALHKQAIQMSAAAPAASGHQDSPEPSRPASAAPEEEPKEKEPPPATPKKPKDPPPPAETPPPTPKERRAASAKPVNRPPPAPKPKEPARDPTPLPPRDPTPPPASSPTPSPPDENDDDEMIKLLEKFIKDNLQSVLHPDENAPKDPESQNSESNKQIIQEIFDNLFSPEDELLLKEAAMNQNEK